MVMSRKSVQLRGLLLGHRSNQVECKWAPSHRFRSLTPRRKGQRGHCCCCYCQARYLPPSPAKCPGSLAREAPQHKDHPAKPPPSEEDRPSLSCHVLVAYRSCPSSVP